MQAGTIAPSIFEGHSKEGQQISFQDKEIFSHRPNLANATVKSSACHNAKWTWEDADHYNATEDVAVFEMDRLAISTTSTNASKQNRTPTESIAVEDIDLTREAVPLQQDHGPHSELPMCFPILKAMILRPTASLLTDP